MKYPKKVKLTGREKRAKSVRKKVYGTAERPRLSVYRSLKNIYAQLIDDERGETILGVSSLCPDIKEQHIEGGKVNSAKAVGMILAEKSKAKGITKVVFDRNGFLYHGCVKAVAEGARERGLNF
ncbi:MAG TPA: 50S ribosomal protein L18 [Anaerolineae bacterium]|nr:50S ribosomal protein L18 [Anaerolineae bacterium]